MATLTWLLDVNAPNAARTFDQISARVDELDRNLRKTRELTVGDKQAMATFARLDLQADRFKDRIHNMPLTLEGAGRAEAQLLALEATADRLREKVGDAGKRGILGRLGGLFGGAGGVIGGAGQGIGGVVSSLGQYGQGALYGAGGLLAAILGPALLPVALGGVTGLGAGGLALMLGAKGAPLLQADRQALARARLAVAGTPGTPATAAQLLALQQAQAKLAHDQGLYGEFTPLNQTFAGLGRTALGVFSGALEKGGPAAIGPGGRPIAGSGAPSFLTGLTGILKQIDGFVKTLGPELANLFRASLPFLQTFVKFLEQAAKVLLPVFTQMLQQMTPLLPLISKGLMNIVDGLAGFLKAIGPSGMEASAKIFVVVTKGMAAILVALGHTINWLTEHIPDWAHNIAAWWDRLRGWTASTFDTIRHDIMSFFHGVASDFDTWRHGWAHIWDEVYSNTIGVVIRLDKDILGWFSKIPGQVGGALRDLGGKLFSIGKTAITDLLNGLKSVWGGLWSWIKNTIGGIPHDILSFFHMSPPHPGSAFFDLGASFMHHLEAGIKSRAASVTNAIGMGAAGGGLAGGAVVSLARRMAGLYGWGNQWGAINAVAMRESGWSMTARNPSSGAYGIAQFINGPSEYYQYGGNPGTAAGQITAFYNYIKQRYSTPANAWAHELNFGWYDRGGWLPPGLSLALNQTGRPERVGGGGDTVNIYVTVGHGTHPVAAAQEIVKLLNQGAKSGVKLRTSILGPG